MGSCSAQGECKTFPDNGGNGCSSASGCGALRSFCGCDGTMVVTGCGYPDGYASGPTTPGLSCDDGGLDSGEGQDSSLEASMMSEAGESGTLDGAPGEASNADAGVQ